MRAPFLRFLLLGGDEQAPVHEQGVQLAGAFVEGQLDLGGCRIPHNMDLKHCRFTDLLFAQDARVQGLITLQGSYLTQGINADRLQCDGGLSLRNGFKATGEVRLLGAQIGGNLSCGGGQFEVKGGDALSFDRAVVKGDVFFNNSFKASGQVRLLGAQISGNMECSSGRFESREGDALSFDRAVVKGDVFFDAGFKAFGKVRLIGAHISGNMECSGAQFEVKEGEAISADGAMVEGDVFFNGGFRAIGEVRLLGALISGNLDCRGGKFEVQEGDALSFDRAVVKGGVFFINDFKATGKVRLLGAQIGGNLACRGGQFDVKEGDALSVDGATVEGVWHFRGLERPVRVNASHLQVAVLIDAIESWAEGSVLDGLRYGTLGGDAPTRATARLHWLRKQGAGHLGMADGGEDFRPQPWRQLQRVLRDMGHVEEARQVGIAFEQQLRKAGRIGGTAPGTWKLPAKGKRAVAHVGHGLFGLLAGYGYRPMRLMGWMVLVWLICAVFYWRLALPPNNAIGPSDPLVFQNERYAHCVPGSPAAAAAAASGAPHAGNWYLCGPLPAEYSTFSPWVYSLDIILPLVDLGQEKAWGPLVPTPQQDAWNEWLARSHGHKVRWLIWFETLFGWIGSLLLVGIVSGIARRTEE
ncbi:MAG: membrane-associated oxidoreductase [Comamonadaceae bacterium]|nr:MAG: membrane-associated oxidoreductase [Comamonadaceae bacterium]